jgi:3-hydroxyisobutyrate dehydrogenase-like beta-hydroxyacid dehydrogenase
VTSVGVVGLGAMGSRIALRLAETGHELVVWNRDRAKAGPLLEVGATEARSPAGVTERAEAVIVMVRDPQALREVTEGPAGIAAGATSLTTVLQMTTVEPAAIARLESLLPPGAGLLDTPVLGSLAEAEAGTLKIFAGGPGALVERWKPLLSTLGAVVHVGELGAATAAKLVANSTLFGTLGVLAEALSLADALGLPRTVAFEVLATTPIAAQAERRRESIESGEYPTRFALSLARKDADLIAAAAAVGGVDLRLAAAARAWLADAERDGAGELDYSAMIARVLDGGRSK